MKVFVTGGAGFIGSHLVRTLIHQGHKVVNYDALTYAGNLENLSDVEKNPAYVFVRGDISDLKKLQDTFSQHKPDVVIHVAAESHVDRSILSSDLFLKTNVLGTQILLDVSRSFHIERFVQVSTDEVYGALGEQGKFTEETALAPNSPYSASKAAGDLMCRAYFHTHRFPVIITRCSNNYGPYHFPEKLIPLVITNLIENKKVPVYGDGQQVRDWIAVTDHCKGIMAALTHGEPGEVYNLGGNSEKTNLDVVKTLLRILGKPESFIEFVQDRPGHDRRYAIDYSKASKELNWEPKENFTEYLKTTVSWYQNNEVWWRRVKSGDYQMYYQTQYANRKSA